MDLLAHMRAASTLKSALVGNGCNVFRILPEKWNNAVLPFLGRAAEYVSRRAAVVVVVSGVSSTLTRRPPLMDVSECLDCHFRANIQIATHQFGVHRPGKLSTCHFLPVMQNCQSCSFPFQFLDHGSSHDAG